MIMKFISGEYTKDCLLQEFQPFIDKDKKSD